MNKKQLEEFQEIRNLLGELHQMWIDNEPDLHHKSNEGYIGVFYPNWFCAGGKEEYQSPEASGIEIYSYLFGPNRLHTFDSFSEALEEVRKWYKDYTTWAQETDYGRI